MNHQGDIGSGGSQQIRDRHRIHGDQHALGHAIFANDGLGNGFAGFDDTRRDLFVEFRGEHSGVQRRQRMPVPLQNGPESFPERGYVRAALSLAGHLPALSVDPDDGLWTGRSTGRDDSVAGQQICAALGQAVEQHFQFLTGVAVGLVEDQHDRVIRLA